MTSPINGLCGRISHAFENSNPTALDQLKAAIDSGLISREIELAQDGEMHMPKICKPSTLKPAVICLHGQYLQMLWAFTYGWFVIYEKGIQEPWMHGSYNGIIKYDNPLLQRAAQLLEWIGTNEKEWPCQRPSPSNWATDEEKSFTEKANTIFIKAIVFLLHHEFAHAKLRHVDTPECPPTSDETKILERDADGFAFSALISQSDDEQHRRIQGWSVLVPVLCALFVEKDSSRLFPRKHPFIHHRVDEVLKRLNFQERCNQDYFTYLCLTITKMVVVRFGLSEGQQTFPTAAEGLQNNLDKLDNLHELHRPRGSNP